MSASKIVSAAQVAASVSKRSRKRRKGVQDDKSKDKTTDRSSSDSAQSSAPSSAEEDSEPDFDPVDVAFEFFDPQAQDYEAIKRLLVQLFGADAVDLPLDGIVELILAQGTIGSTVKVDGHESDPYAILTVLNFSSNVHPSLEKLRDYLWKKCEHIKTQWSTSTGDRCLGKLLHPTKATEETVGLLISERLVNMPVQILPPMLNMLQEELEWAIADKEPYQFDWWLIPTRVYQCVVSDLIASGSDMEDGAPKSSKRGKKSKRRAALGTGTVVPTIESFHAEDDIIAKHATETITYAFTRQSQTVPDSQRAFTDYGIDPRGRLMLLSAKHWEATTSALKQALQ